MSPVEPAAPAAPPGPTRSVEAAGRTTLDDLVAERSIIVCCGSGGVGKTTTAAVVALEGARLGRKTVVVTIDPARRLADALGLEGIADSPTRIEGDWPGELWATMLDARSTFDSLVAKHAATPEQGERILANTFYRNISGALSGTQEYMAMEKLYELHEEGRYDLIVLDTPPSRNALDFLDAPERLARFIDSRSLQFFLAPGRRGIRILGRGTGLLFGALKRVTGIDLLQDLSEFFQSFGSMAGDFNERANRVNQLLTSDSATFLLVTSPQRASIEEAEHFRRRLREDRMPFGGAVVNRVHELGLAEPAADRAVLERELTGMVGDGLARKIARNLDDYLALARHDADSVAQLRERLGPHERLVLVPYLDEDVHDLEGLARLGEHLFAR